MASTYDKFPSIQVRGFDTAVSVGPDAIQRRIASHNPRILVVDTYPGTDDAALLPALQDLFNPDLTLDASTALLSPDKLSALVDADLTNDPVFGRMTHLSLQDLFDADKLQALQTKLKQSPGRVLVYGTGAALIAPKTGLLIYADLARWEIQLRQRAGKAGNLGLPLSAGTPAQKYKRAFFLDWRLADRHKREIWPRINFFLDAHNPQSLKLVNAPAIRAGLAHTVTRPFRVVPFFDPGPWGGQWMKEVCDLDRSKKNFAWCFDCVPEENSLLLRFGNETIELPSINLVFQHPQQLLGDAVYGRFGAEFPIRFDFLDTIQGGNLSLQVHPLTEYAHTHFGLQYTQDESYYLLDAEEGATVYLGFKENVNPQEFVEALETAQQAGLAASAASFDAAKYINQFPAKKHDHFLIPAGTIHCSGAGAMVLEISATPYIFTFKLWDWGRMGLDGKPRPIHLTHGARNLQWSRTTDWVKTNLVNTITPLSSGPGYREERTGLHTLEFIETRRHWFTAPVDHDTHGTVNVLNLIQGEKALIESPSGAFEPFTVHYAETFILPAAVGPYRITPKGAGEHATIKAFVRAQP